MGDTTLQGLMFAFYEKYQFFTYFAVEYVSRLKACAASIIMNLTSLSAKSAAILVNNPSSETANVT